MELQQIEVFIDAEGHVRLEVRGVKGQHCLTLTKGLETVLGGKVSREMTPEASESVSSANNDRLKQWS